MASSFRHESEGSCEDWDGFLNQLSDLKTDTSGVCFHTEKNLVSDKQQEYKQASYADPALCSDGDNVRRAILGRKSSEDGSGNSQATGRKSLSHFKEILKSKLTEVDDLDIEILRSDPENPLHSVKTFQEMKLKEPLLRGVSAMGLYKPSTIQEKALSSLIGSTPQNMIAQSQSGTGKTATFLLAMLSRVRPEDTFCQCLCMAPTRELAQQIVSVGRRMAAFMENVTFGLAVRDEQAPVGPDRYVTAQIVVGTPGTVMNWVRGTGAVCLDPSKLAVFVLDEADVMMEQEGFLNISKRIKSKLSPSCQILLFSATYGDSVMEFARELVPNPIEIRVKRTQLPLKNIKQYYVLFSDWMEKYEALKDIYGDFDVGQAIIFCATRKEATWLEGRLTLDGHKVIVLSGDLEILDEGITEVMFRELTGLDIPQVNLVINWNMPVTRSGAADCETYLHRIGRSGRFGKEGLAVNFLTTEEKPIIEQLEQHFQISIPPLTIDDIPV
ncbi:DEAD box ATP-dependent RNA helicase [Paragonimus heterotremus]|uniref:RNA helicase n=1 Tax=Paragonimus heterotremus TaxID=100268 RepID=A0A8J4STG5_9TREM|nr:DEAD box ATP-dependent RNA helicase [Paragonimus heterotremus]